MPYPIEKKLVITLASSALFDLTKAHKVFKEKGEDAYRKYQRKHCNVPFPTGVAFPFVKRLLKLNEAFPDIQPVEVILLSKNDPETGLRAFRSIKKYKLNITRAAFLTGKSPFEYIPAFNASLFLSANPRDVQNAIDAKYPAGRVLPAQIKDDEEDNEVRIAFDFDGVLADDSAETVYQKSKSLKKFLKFEHKNIKLSHPPGPLKDFFNKIAHLQQLEIEREKKERGYKRLLRTAIITARNAPSNERFVTTLRKWGVSSDATFFLGGIEKARILKIMKPHIYFDDQLTHLEEAALQVPSVHIPFGIANRK
jgi:5'-nucleotidase